MSLQKFYLLKDERTLLTYKSTQHALNLYKNNVELTFIVPGIYILTDINKSMFRKSIKE